MAEFTHLHVHTEFSLLDGLAKIEPLMARARELGMHSLAITDHGTMYGVIQFYKAAKKHGIKPIIGCELYVARRGRTQRVHGKDAKPYHLTALARNETGYKNLIQLVTKAQLEGFYYKPRVDRELLEAHSEGLIILSGCPTAQIPRLIRQGQVQEARELAGWFREVFGPENFYIEIQQHDNIDFLDQLNRELVAMSRDLDIPLVATNDVHFTRPEDSYAHEVLLCIQTGTTIKDPNRMRIGRTFYLRSPQEMAELFRELPEALTNTLRIAEQCELEIPFGQHHLPRFDVPEGYDPHSYLRHLCEEGIRRRYPEMTPEVRERLEYELQVIHQMGFDSYFLIVWDLCRFAREQGIWWNVRGSGAGSIVAYALGITNIDPLKHNLIFERFLNPGRVSMPDIDLDFPDDQRDQLIRYTYEKYGSDRVAQIITFGTMGARAAIRDAGRALDLPQNEVDRVARLVPAIPGMPITIKEALEGERQVPELRELYETQEYVRELLDTAQSLEGVARHASTHAAGVVVSDKPLVEYVPLHRPTRGNAEDALPVTQYAMEDIEAIGLLKIDFLGLATLTVMRRAVELIEKHHGVKLDMHSIPLDDPAIYELLSSGEVTGVFQVEGAGMRRMLREMKPSRFDHVVAAISLYRPGPMEYIPTYIARMHGREPVKYRHPKLKPILEETYAIIVYQEQIIRIARDLAGYDAGEADLMRRAVGKKKKKELLKHRDKFVRGAVERGIPEEVAHKIFDDIEFFARYGFNKCLPGDTEMADARTGRLVRIEDLYHGRASLETTVTCDTETLRLREGVVVDVFDNGVKPVYRLTTASGRQIEATENHPFYTFEGWTLLKDLKVGDMIAVPRLLPVEGQATWPDYEVTALGYLLAEGNLCHPSSVYFYTRDETLLRTYIEAAEAFDNVACSVRRHRDTFSAYARRVDRSRPPGIVTWAQNLGIWGLKADQKHIPAAAFELNNCQVALLLARLWEGDGHISSTSRLLFYATASERLARQMQHLLLRLGIVARLRRVEFPYKEGRIGWQLFITGNANLRRFAETVGVHFAREADRQQLEQLVLKHDNDLTSKDVVPLGIKHIVRAAKASHGMTWEEIQQATGVAPREFYPSSTATKKGFRRETIARLATHFNDENLAIYAENDIYWDPVVAIEYGGEKRTYDLTVAETHNFVANDIIVHNSHAADYAVITCQTAYLKAKYPVEYATALLSVERDNTDKIALIAADCHRMGIKLLPPDVNYSELDFTIEKLPEEVVHQENLQRPELVEGQHRRGIRFGLGAIKNVGEGPVQAILKARAEGGPFQDLDDFCRRVDLRHVGRRALECLIKAGALDRFGRRDQLLAVMDRMIGVSQQAHQAAEVGQLSMFGGPMAPALAGSMFDPLPDVPEVPQKTRLGWEKELTGLFLSEHPLHRMAGDLDRIATARCGEIDASMKGQVVTVAGMVSSVRRITTRKGDPMAFAQIEDLQGSVEVTVFPRMWQTTSELWQEDNLIVVRGRVEQRDERVQIICNEAWRYQPGEGPPSADPAGRRQKAVGSAGSVEDKLPTADSFLPSGTAVGGRPTAVASKAGPAVAQSAEEPSFHLMITIQRTGDQETDIRHIGQVYDLLTGYEGNDRFSLIVVNGDSGVRLDFPNDTTRYCVSLLENLRALVGESAIRVEAVNR